MSFDLSVGDTVVFRTRRCWDNYKVVCLYVQWPSGFRDV